MWVCIKIGRPPRQRPQDFEGKYIYSRPNRSKHTHTHLDGDRSIIDLRSTRSVVFAERFIESEVVGRESWVVTAGSQLISVSLGCLLDCGQIPWGGTGCCRVMSPFFPAPQTPARCYRLSHLMVQSKRRAPALEPLQLLQLPSPRPKRKALRP